MTPVPNVHIREVPPEALDMLRAAAERNGRSLNAELVRVLVAAAAREDRTAELQRRLEQIRARFEQRGGRYARGLEPETIIREARDAC